MKHLFRLVWNRKRQNALVVTEIFFSFVVLFAVTAAGVWVLDGLRRPLGFGVANVLSVTIRKGSGDFSGQKASWAPLENALRRVKAMPEVEGVAAMISAPYSRSTWQSENERGGRKFEYQENFATDEVADVLGLKVTAGRWFSREDDATQAWQPVVINERLRREVFGSGDPIGQLLSDPPKDLPPGEEFTPRRVVGVLTDFRKDGEVAPLINYVFNRVTPSKTTPPFPDTLVVRVRPGTPPAFEETLGRAVQQVDPHWSVVVKPLSELRASRMKLRLAPLVLLGLVGLFLLLMVVLGLTGVVWQNVTRRTREIGLRRAKGSTRGQVVLLVVGEVLVVTAFGVLPALLLLVQIPLLGAIRGVGPDVFFTSLGGSVAMMFLLTALCALAPARMALRLSPAEALRDE